MARNGPVAPILTFQVEQAVLKRANETGFSLASYFYTNDLARVNRVVER